VIFEGLSEKLQNTFRKLRSRGKLRESDVKEALREVKLALLGADVNVKVVKDFTKRIQERAIGQEVLQSLTPAQQVVKIVNEELTDLLGGETTGLELATGRVPVIMLVGLQGSGKTTTTAKLGKWLKNRGDHPLMVAADVYRPAAIKQLEVLGEQIEIPVFSMGDRQSPVDICRSAVAHAGKNGHNVVLLDTAGRLHVDTEMMAELKQIDSALKPDEKLLVADAMTGQDAVNVANQFNQDLQITGIILTKLDGDARGGAALSMKAATGRPVKFVGTGEKMDALEVFHPDRMASRILGMGDVLSLIEKAEAAIDEQKARELSEKLGNDEFTLDDFLDQLQNIRQMGPLEQLVGMFPGVGGKLKNLDFDESRLVKIEAIINSMTREERRRPVIIKGSRRKRIACGSGTSVQDVNQLLKQFKQTREWMKQLNSMQKSGKLRGMMSLFR